MTEPRNPPYIWATSLSKLLTGDDSCEWSSWYRANHKNYERMPPSSDLVRWQMSHTALLNSMLDELERDGLIVSIEGQNTFSLEGNSGATIGGRPDIIALEPGGERGTIYDAKTGNPRVSDSAQLMIYMYALPRTSRFRGLRFDGRIVYSRHDDVEIPSDAVDDEFVDNLHSLIRRVAGPTPARRVPSERECGWCALTSDDCSERIG